MLGAAVLALAGCRSPRRPPAAMAPPEPQPKLAAESTFLDGTLAVTAVLEPFSFRRPGKQSSQEVNADDSPAARGERPARGMGGGGGMGMGGPPPGGGGGMGGPPPGGGGAPSGGGGGMGGGMMGPLRQSLAITFTNTSDEPIHMRVAEVKSILGSFVPEPETFTLEAGATQNLTPMRAGFRENLTELHLTLRIRTIEANETQELVLTKTDDQPEPPPPPPENS